MPSPSLFRILLTTKPSKTSEGMSDSCMPRPLLLILHNSSFFPILFALWEW